MVILFFFIWSIADFADANGWVQLSKDVSSSKGGSAFFCFFSALFSLVVSVLAALNIIYFCRRDKSGEDE